MILFYLYLSITILSFAFSLFFIKKMNFRAIIICLCVFVVFAFGTTIQAALNGILK